MKILWKIKLLWWDLKIWYKDGFMKREEWNKYEYIKDKARGII